MTTNDIANLIASISQILAALAQLVAVVWRGK